MLLALLLAQLATAPIGPAAPPQPDIEVTGRHLSRLRLSLDLDGGVLKACRITVSSGDALIDALACPAARTCVAQRPRTSTVLLACIDQRIGTAVRAHDGVPGSINGAER
ncbi:hypothetical protein AVM11_13245 [Sphingomonas melonis TY]|uniref:Uncharacterized protein n=1 Tax=Sphingomonas melonis TY TaxID=621456 RepID=A0A175Y6U5_9SPHN|nr:MULTISPECIES: hypothetical protein [Sphingomonas]MBI0531550.1 hypothetical protein [Sphingomonas sp. TX0522]AOW24211.1 hypothetical protein BJP26_12035 [Sphingomonas melonis TY]ATI55260.1 hypothetical protein CP552_06025 [Sphingomonas melonis]KZB96383.1 hypothetical protein AVM11_13245 [Sphingomonas melonis TY]MBX8843710.1 hypothetical protein [Sphingomonas melonis]